MQSAAAFWRGNFLAGFSLGDAPGFDDWVAFQREVWNRRLGLILDRLSEIQFAHGETASATETASQWIALDTLNEVAYRRKMRAHYAAGERGQALETYETCRTMLATELGVEPEPDTAALAARIRTQPPPAQPDIPISTPRLLNADTSVAFLGNLFAGRRSEYQSLINSFDSATANQPQLVVLRGEAGMVKLVLPENLEHGPASRGASCCKEAPLKVAVTYRFNRWWTHSGCDLNIKTRFMIFWMMSGCLN